MAEVTSRSSAGTQWHGPWSWLEAHTQVGPARRKVEIHDRNGKLLARWEGWSLTALGAVANADRLRTDRQPRKGRSAR